jgi:hypothetical protein
VHPELDKPFKLKVDASGFVIGTVLLQQKDNGKKHPIAYYSKTLSAAEHNYDIFNLELLVVVNSLNNWCPFLAGSLHKVIVYSDNQNLLYWKESHQCDSATREHFHKDNCDHLSTTLSRRRAPQTMG